MAKTAGNPSKTNAQTTDQLDQKIIKSVLECYTTKSGPRLAALFDQLYAPDTTFADPFVVASPRHEARLQFLSLQHFFDSVTATANSTTTTSTNETRVDVHFDYFWSRNSWLSRMILPEVTPLDAVIVLKHNEDGKIISHLDEWHSPAVGALPTTLRTVNVKVLNGVFRLLGWERELGPLDGSSVAATATAKED
jgi:hypothetical protein